MEQRIVLVAETGSDITPELAKEYGIFLVPMHVSMGDQTLDDGAFPPEDVCAFIDQQARGCKCVGCWKVYGDEDRAKKKFRQYESSTL